MTFSGDAFILKYVQSQKSNPKPSSKHSAKTQWDSSNPDLTFVHEEMKKNFVFSTGIFPKISLSSGIFQEKSINRL